MIRTVLFVGTNLAILAMLTFVLRITGLDAWLAGQTGMPIMFWLILAAALGMGGSFISLALSKFIAKKTMRLHIIEEPENATERWLLETVRRQAQAAGIGMPEVAIQPSPALNAFATGMSKNNALVAVTVGLLKGMSQDEVEAVLAHEVSHVANGDMVTMALLQGVLNTFVILLARVIGTVVDRAVFRTERGVGPGFFIATIVAEIVLGILATMVVMAFSRWREFRADAGGAQLAGRQKMIAALQRLGGHTPPPMPEEFEALGISGRVGGGLKKLFMSHPPIAERVAALQRG